MSDGGCVCGHAAADHSRGEICDLERGRSTQLYFEAACELCTCRQFRTDDAPAAAEKPTPTGRIVAWTTVAGEGEFAGLDAFDDAINALLADGYQPHGQMLAIPSGSGIRYVQAMVKT